MSSFSPTPTTIFLNVSVTRLFQKIPSMRGLMGNTMAKTLREISITKELNKSLELEVWS
jgi:hypothetical protein